MSFQVWVPPSRAVVVATHAPVVVFVHNERERAVHVALFGHEVTVWTEWDRFEAVFHRAKVAVVVLPFLEGREFALLVGLMVAHPLVPVVLVTSEVPDNVRHITAARFAEVLFLHEFEAQLAAAVTAAVVASVPQQAIREIQAMRDLNGSLRTAMIAAWTEPHPMRDVPDLAEAGGMGRSRVYRLWAGAFGGASTPHDFLLFIALYHVIRRRRRGGSWVAAARVIGFDDRTLRSAARQLFSMDLDQVASAGSTVWISVLRSVLGRVAD